MHYIPYFDFRLSKIGDKNRIYEFYTTNLILIAFQSILLILFMNTNFSNKLNLFIATYFIYFGIFHIINLSVYFNKYLNHKSKNYILNVEYNKLEKSKHIKYIFLIIYIWLSYSTLIFLFTFIFDSIRRLYYKQNYTFCEYYRFFYLKFPYIIMEIVLNGCYLCESEDVNILCEFRNIFIDSNFDLKKENSENLKSLLLAKDQFLYLTKNSDTAFYCLFIIKKNKINVVVK